MGMECAIAHLPSNHSVEATAVNNSIPSRKMRPTHRFLMNIWR